MASLKLTHIGICVTELSRSLDFYCQGLGFQQVSELAMEGEPAATLLELPDVSLRAVYLERDGVRIELLHYPRPGAFAEAQPRPMNRAGLTHLSFQVDSLEEAVKQLCAHGGRLLEGSRIELPEAGAAAAFVTDPDGTRIELVQMPRG
jgi:catechol 2,3-dioxygenase-like lactoylglutathione lyase family enzyme